MLANVTIQAVLFDMDGVLVDVSRSYRRAIEETIFHFTGRKVPASLVQRYKNVGGFNDDWKLTHAVITDSGMEVPFHRVVQEFQKRYRGENWDGFIAEEPALIETESLAELRKRSRIMGIVTGRPEAEAKWTLDRFGWKKYFPLLVPREKQEGRGKPDPFPLQHALTILDAAGVTLAPEQTLYIGDTVDDMEAARSAGMWAVGMVPPYVNQQKHVQLLRDRGAHLVLDDPNDLVEVVSSFGSHVSSVAQNGD